MDRSRAADRQKQLQRQQLHLWKAAVETAHDDFDWTIDKRNVAAYNKEEKEKYDKVYENTFVQITDGELIKGLVVGVTKTDVVVNIGFKSDGLVSLNEFRDLPESKERRRSGSDGDGKRRPGRSSAPEP